VHLYSLSIDNSIYLKFLGTVIKKTCNSHQHCASE
jgi:hypothetical protein